MELSRLESKTVQWHHDRNLIDGATDWSQSGKLLEEFIELIAAQYYEKPPEALAEIVIEMVNDLLLRGRIKSVAMDDKDSAKLDAIGDMIVVLTNIAERNKSSLETCLGIAYNEIKDRKGKMINGSFVKESDL
jgi:hypothetical protein